LTGVSAGLKIKKEEHCDKRLASCQLYKVKQPSLGRVAVVAFTIIRLITIFTILILQKAFRKTFRKSSEKVRKSCCGCIAGILKSSYNVKAALGGSRQFICTLLPMKQNRDWKA